jgi:capsular exopolysaccharide synthesis family protein
VGFALSAGAILLIDHFAKSLKNAGQTEGLLGLPILGQLSDVNHGKGGLVSLQDPLSPESEAFRALGASLQIATAGRKLGTLMVANAGAAEGKTPIAANLAIVYAQQGKQVILLDGDLRHPHLHSLFATENQKGLANMIAGSPSMTGIGDGVKDVDGLTLIPSGAAANVSTGWMDAEKWALVLSKLHQPENLVIVDAASSETADAQTLASSVDGVLLVIRAGQTPADSAQATLRRFQLAGAKVLGVVFCSGLHDQVLKTQGFSWARFKLRKKEDHSAGGSKIEDAPVLPS